MPKPKQELGDVTKVLDIDPSIQPLNHFPAGFSLHESEWTEHKELQFHCSKSYAQGNTPYNGATYKYDVALVPPVSYIAQSLKSMQGIYTCTVEGKFHRIVTRDYLDENDTFIHYMRPDRNGIQRDAYKMKPQAELDFIATYKAVNNISDNDYLYMPLYFIESINNLYSRNLQRLQWASTTNDAVIKSRQLNQFIADTIYAWNDPLTKYDTNKKAQTIPTVAIPNNAVASIDY